MLKRLLCFVLSLIFFTSSFSAVYSLARIDKSLLTDGKLHIYMCGTGNPEISMQTLRHPACVAIVGDEQFFLVDAGEGAIQTIAYLGLPFFDIFNVFVTHWHSDHFSGLGQVINETWLANRQKPINVYGPKGVKKVLSGLKKAYSLDAKFRIENRQGGLKKYLAFGVPKEIKAIDKGAQIYENKNITVYAFKVNHSPVTPALGYRIYYKGCKLVISGDTKIVPSLAENAKNADVLINEAYSRYYYDQQKALAKSSSKDYRLSIDYLNQTKHYHSDSIELAKMAEQSKVKHLFITHLTPAIGTSPAQKDTFTTGMKKYYQGPITVTDDRDEIVLDYKDGKCNVKYIPAQQPNLKLYQVKRP